MGIHRVRLTASSADRAIHSLLESCRDSVTAAWAYVTEQARPPDVLARFRAAGFQHVRRFQSLACDLSKIKRIQVARAIRTEIISDYSVFDKRTPHPTIGLVNTDRRREALAKFEKLDGRRPRRTWHFLASISGRPAGASTAFFNSGIVGVYDVATVPEFRRLGVGSAVTRAVMRFALEQGYHAAALIATSQGAALYRKLGFRTVGYTSLLYYSRNKMRRRRRG